MVRTTTLLAVAALISVASEARAALIATFSVDVCGHEATHVVVVDGTGKVIESWRGDLVPGASVPLKEFKIPLEHKIEPRLTKDPLPKLPEKITGKRLVLFLRKGGPKSSGNYAAPTAGWGAGHWSSSFLASTVWVEDGFAFTLKQWYTTVDPLRMTYIGTEADLKEQVEGINKAFRDSLAEARAIPKLGLRAGVLAGLVKKYPGFAAETFAELERCRSDALPALRSIIKSDDVSESDVVAAYAVMAKIGEPARDDLMALCKAQLGSWKNLSKAVLYNEGLDPITEHVYRQLVAGTSNPDAFRGLTDDQRKTLRELRELWVEHPVLSTLGKEGDRIQDRLDRILKSEKR